jgi:mannose-6-phosphate isomerase-like protein (cupin superfamily)
MKAIPIAALGLLFALASASADTVPAPMQMAPADSMAHALLTNQRDLKWNRIFPDAGENSAEIAILHSDPVTHATQLFIRVPKNSHVPAHWHSANETHTVLEGTFVMECEGKRSALTAGGFNYMPARMHHEAWTTPKEGALLFITVDSAWDVNFLNGPPKPADLVGGVAAPKP